jgi:hypothetical protein
MHLLLMLSLGQRYSGETNWSIIVPLVILILVVGITLAVKNLRKGSR